ncbi:tRNA lysidine(34) synthetase TilS [Croceicoccus sp. Ery5]|uniref:tRNA lysidine(34) synthetase TilS n=1 Tax=Croceicoccus sp. Ery5 TaxID=1703340 RepID=UPI001E377CDB|nr:tRNA lysidine(34) synthetase TilS [Croceicoccus sp. Ery5]
MIEPDARLGIAVSGGPDSLAMLLLAATAFPDRIEAATVDHRLRPESADEAAMVARVCRDRGIGHTVLTVTLPDHGNVQANARRERYRALGQWAREHGLAAIATAHHIEDQAETLLMRLNRGSGLKGLAAMRNRRPVPMAADIGLIRPLLGWHRSELAAICAAAGLEPAQDPSNRDPKYDRARIRAAMTGTDWIDPSALARSARHLRDAFEALEEAVDAELQTRIVFLPEEQGAVYAPSPRQFGVRGLRFRVLEKLIGELGRSHGAPRGAEIDRLLDTLESGGKTTLAGLECTVRSGVNGPEWLFTPEPARKTG